MQERYLISYEALAEGLDEGDAHAIDASIHLLQSAHYESRSRVVTLVGDFEVEQSVPVLERWFDAPWPAQTAAWWVLSYNERLTPSKAGALREALDPLSRIDASVHESVAVQMAGWVYEYVMHTPTERVQIPQTVEETLRIWLDSSHPQLALSSLQTLLTMGAAVTRTDAAPVIALAENANIAGVDRIGMRCGFLESAERLADQVLNDGPWSDLAVRAFVQALPDNARERFESVRLPRRLVAQDREIHSATILAAHGDSNARDWLEKACKIRDPRRRALAWAGRIRALCRAEDEEQRAKVGKQLLRESEAVRAWVISTLDPACPMQRQWLEQASKYGTDEERAAVRDALRAYARRRPLVPDAAQ